MACNQKQESETQRRLFRNYGGSSESSTPANITPLGLERMQTRRSIEDIIEDMRMKRELDYLDL